MLKFYWNGIKGVSGKLQRCSYSDAQLINFPAGTITIYAKSGVLFSAEVRDAFKVENDSDAMTDYFEDDRIRVEATHPMFSQVKSALESRTAHYAKRTA